MITATELKTVLTHPLFSGVPIESIRSAISNEGSRSESLLDGQPIPTEDHIGFVLDGRAAVYTADESRRVLLRVLNVGDAFGLAGLFSEENEVSKICADGACKCLFFSERAVSRMLEESDAFRKNYIGFLTGRIRFLNRKIAYLTAGSAERRLALYLLSLGTGEMVLKDSIGSLSDLLNLGRASLYRAFDKLCEDGYLIKNGRRLTILNAEAMLNAYK